VAAQVTASQHAEPDRPDATSVSPQHHSLTVEVLQRLVESAQYLSVRYTQRLADQGAVASVGSRGDSFDNALAEAVKGLYKPS